MALLQLVKRVVIVPDEFLHFTIRSKDADVEFSQDLRAKRPLRANGFPAGTIGSTAFSRIHLHIKWVFLDLFASQPTLVPGFRKGSNGLSKFYARRARPLLHSGHPDVGGDAVDPGQGRGPGCGARDALERSSRRHRARHAGAGSFDFGELS